MNQDKMIRSVRDYMSTGDRKYRDYEINFAVSQAMIGIEGAVQWLVERETEFIMGKVPNEIIIEDSNENS